jgi:hypothetical protein
MTDKYYWIYDKIYGCICNKITSVSKHNAIQRDWGFKTYELLTATVGGGAWSTSCSSRFALGEKFLPPTPGTDVIGAWVCPRAYMDVEAKRKILFPDGDSNLSRPAYRQSTDWVILALISGVRWFLKKISISLPLSTGGLWKGIQWNFYKSNFKGNKKIFEW